MNQPGNVVKEFVHCALLEAARVTESKEEYGNYPSKVGDWAKLMSDTAKEKNLCFAFYHVLDYKKEEFQQQFEAFFKTKNGGLNYDPNMTVTTELGKTKKLSELIASEVRNKRKRVNCKLRRLFNLTISPKEQGKGGKGVKLSEQRNQDEKNRLRRKKYARVKTNKNKRVFFRRTADKPPEVSENLMQCLSMVSLK